MNFDTSKLNQSSFKGVPFYTDKTQLSGGKRLTTHKFINSGTKVEENGVDSDTFKIKAYLGGADYLEEKEALIKALKSTGAGTLIDQFYGEITVQAGPFIVNESKQELGKATIDITFQREETSLVVEDLTVYDIDSLDETLAVFATDYEEGLGADIFDDIANSITEGLNQLNNIVKFLEDQVDFVRNVRNTIGSTIAGIKSSVISIVALSAELERLYSSFGEVLNLDLYGPDDERTWTNQIRQTLEDELSRSAATDIGAAINQNTKAFTVALVGLLTQTAIKNLDKVEFSTGSDFGGVKDDILTILDLLQNDIETNLGDDIENITARYALLDKLRASKALFIQFYTERYSKLQNLEKTPQVITTDILSLTMNKYRDISRVDEVIGNNDIIDPLFISGDLELLRR